ncbi:MAG: tetratricopeptide repeat protein [Treponema sp.]|nr:tetratricopeptide repeat protein [Treponema sp.]
MTEIAESGGELQRGIELFQLKQWNLALQEFLQVKFENLDTGETMELTYYLGLCYAKLEQYNDALLHLEKVITAGWNPLRTYQCRMTLAYIYVMTDRSKMAEFELARLVSGGFESAQLYTAMAYVAWDQGRLKKAVELYEKALKIDAESTTAMNGLGYILVDTGMDVSRGIRYCRQAVERNPRNAAYLDSLGWAYFKSGDPAEAGRWLRRALELAPREREIQNHMRTVAGEAT